MLSLVAEIVALPTATPVTNPVEEILATDSLFDAQTTLRPVRTLL
jgi:hypothetical protein